MIGRIVEIADDRRHLFASRGFMVIRDTEGERQIVGQVPLDDIAAVIANAYGITYTGNLLVALAERGVPFVLCATNHNAVGMLLTLDGHHVQAHRMEAQIAASQPLRKRLWAALVKSKLEQQASALEAISAPHMPIAALAKKVRSGDPDNMEAQGARRYWSLLFGKDFRRDQQGEGINALLNYGYTIARSATARAVVAAGLHPSLGLHHSNDGNPMRLVDDLMEPFRPIVDLKVWQLFHMGQMQVNPESKRALVHVLHDDMQTSAGVTPVMVCMQKLAISLAQVYVGERKMLDLPLPSLPLALSGSLQLS